MYPQPTCPPLDNQQAVWWAELFFSKCVYTHWEAASLAVGTASVMLWFCALLPQVYENWRRKSTDGLSMLFLFLWLVGDTMSVLGCVILHQQPFQLFLALYFVSTDITVFIQYYIYKDNSKHNRLTALGDLSGTIVRGEDGPGNSSETDALMPGSGHAIHAYSSTLAAESETSVIGEQHTEMPKQEPYENGLWEQAFMRMAAAGCLAALVLWLVFYMWQALAGMDLETFGYVMGWSSSILYHLSRLPQLWLNHKRQSVEGLSLAMFSTLYSANLTYGASLVLLIPVSGAEFLRKSASFIYACTGSMLLDIVVLWQFYRFRSKGNRAIRRPN